MIINAIPTSCMRLRKASQAQSFQLQTPLVPASKGLQDTVDSNCAALSTVTPVNSRNSQLDSRDAQQKMRRRLSSSFTSLSSDATHTTFCKTTR